MPQRGQWADRPTRDDQLGFAAYRNALVQVIWEADTPITLHFRPARPIIPWSIFPGMTP